LRYSLRGVDKPKTLVIGIDDTDSKRAMCTTYVGAVALRELEKRGFTRADHPHLVRLNPNCTYKTRGNAAVALLISAQEGQEDEVESVVASTVERLADMECEGTDPGIVMAWEEEAGLLREVYWKALAEIVELGDVRRLLKDLGIRFRCYGEGRGIVGAAAAVGADPSTLMTYEAIAYRVPSKWGSERLVDAESVVEMDRALCDFTFDNYDYEKGEVRITPHTPCPVLAGVRAVTDAHARAGLMMVRFLEPIDFLEVFRTNQATDSHYLPSSVAAAKPLTSCAIRGVISEPPRMTVGGHVFTKLRDSTGEITLAAYYPTGSFREAVLNLAPGDEVIVYGAVKPKPQGLTLNLEKLHIVRLEPKYVVEAPRCPNCSSGSRMKSMGRGKGYRCEKCGFRDPNAVPRRIPVPRPVAQGIYEVAVSARRHLVMPEKLRLLRSHYQHR